MNVLIFLIGGVALVAIVTLLARSLQQPDPLEEMTRTHRLARPGDEPVFLIRATETEPSPVVPDETGTNAEASIS